MKGIQNKFYLKLISVSLFNLTDLLVAFTSLGFTGTPQDDFMRFTFKTTKTVVYKKPSCVLLLKLTNHSDIHIFNRTGVGLHVLDELGIDKSSVSWLNDDHDFYKFEFNYPILLMPALIVSLTDLGYFLYKRTFLSHSQTRKMTKQYKDYRIYFEIDETFGIVSVLISPLA